MCNYHGPSPVRWINNQGQLGDGTTSDSTSQFVYPDFGGSYQALSIAYGNYNYCTLLQNQSIYCWGSGYGSSPVKISISPNHSAQSSASGSFRFIEGGFNQFCTVTTFNEVLCWGSGSDIQSIYQPWENETTSSIQTTGRNGTNSSTPIITTSQSKECWQYGETIEFPLYMSNLNATIQNRGMNLVWEIVSDSTGITEASGSPIIGSTGSNGTLNHTWNYTLSPGHLPSGIYEVHIDPQYGSQSVFQNTPLIYTIEVSTTCFGSGGENNSNNSVYDHVLSGEEIKSLEMGSNFACALTTSNKVACWGDNRLGSFGTGVVDEIDNALPENYSLLPSNLTVKKLVIYQRSVCTLMTDSSIYCWGNAFSSYSNVGNPTPAKISTSVQNFTLDSIVFNGINLIATTDFNMHLLLDGNKTTSLYGYASSFSGVLTYHRKPLFGWMHWIRTRLSRFNSMFRYRPVLFSIQQTRTVYRSFKEHQQGIQGVLPVQRFSFRS